MNVKFRPRLVIPLVVLAALFAGFFVIKDLVGPRFLRNWLVEAVHKECESCELTLSPVYLSLIPLEFRATNAKFKGGVPGATFVHASAEEVYVPFSLTPIFSKHLRVGTIHVSRPEVHVVEGDLETKPSKEEKSPADAPPGMDLEIVGIEVTDAKFSYTRDHLNHKGAIHVNKINASVGEIGVSERLRAQEAKGNATGQLEQSGNFKLEVTAKVFAKSPYVDVKLHLTNQNLSDVNRFFRPSEGILLEGRLIDGKSQVAVRGKNLTASVFALYEDFSVKIKSNEERGGVSAFFQNLLASWKLGEQNVKGQKFDRTGTVTLERDPNRSLISFMLNGMKEAALKVSSQAATDSTTIDPAPITNNKQDMKAQD